MGRGVQMKVIVLGSKGMAGHMISTYLKRQGYDIFEVARTDADYNLDVENPAQMRHFFNSRFHECDYIINCIGVLGPDANKNPARTIYINSYLPHYLQFVYAHKKTKVMHISTDCIFDGKRGYYIEKDLPNETNIYGRSKALGELNNDKDITFRMSIIGTEIKKENRSGLLNWALTNEEDKLFGWTNAHWNGITTLELAKRIHYYIDKELDLSGIIHLVPSESINKYELLNYIDFVFELGKEVVPTQGPKDVNKILVDTREEPICWDIPGYHLQLQQLKYFVENI